MSSINWKRLLQQRLHGQELPRLPSRIPVPRPPKCIAEFLRLADRPDTPLDELARLIERDSQIAASVLRMVNGSRMMLRNKVISISRAINLLGLQRCKILVMSSAIQASISGDAGPSRNVSALFLESQERALFARCFAERIGADREISYVSALLQDLLLPQLASQYPSIYEGSPSEGEPATVREQEQLGWDHTALTAALLADWNFPEEVIACVACHHEHETILKSSEYQLSELAAVAVSALLPGVLNQEPAGIEKLFEYQNVIPEFDFLQMAMDVDEEMRSHAWGGEGRTLLADRLGRLAVNAIEKSRKQSSWIDRTLGNYTLEEQIGQGGMGVVYRARHSMLRRPAAVKMLKASTLSPSAIERFEAEVNITSELSSPHTVQVYDYGRTEDGQLYYVMEYLDGLSLSELIADYGPMPEARIIHILCQVCGSLAEAHAKGLIHRDIKPENIALTVCAGAYDFAKVLDFGLVAVLGEIPSLEGAGKIMGTPCYMAPEAIQAPDQVDARTDIYAIGSVAYYCLTGRPLFGELNPVEILHAQISECPQLPSERCSREFHRLILSCLEKSPGDRPQDMITLAHELAALPTAANWTFNDASDWWTHRRHQPRRPSEADVRSATRPIVQRSTILRSPEDMLAARAD